jgi:hypothetical protein
MYRIETQERTWRMMEDESARQTTIQLVALHGLQDNLDAMMRKVELSILRPRVHEVQEIDDDSEGREDGEESRLQDGRKQGPSTYHRRELRDKLAFRFWLRLPALFSSRVWEIARIDAEQGWDLCFRTYNVRPLDSPIFQFCMEGDLEGVNKLIRHGEASLLDVTPTGESLVTVSIIDTLYRFKTKPQSHYRQ